MKKQKSMLNNDIIEIVHKLEENFKGIRVMVRYQDFEETEYVIHISKDYFKDKKFQKFISKIEDDYSLKDIIFWIRSAKVKKYQIGELIYVSPYVTTSTLLGEVY